MRKIIYDVIVADGFEIRKYPLPWPVAVGRSELIFPEISFEPQGGDVMKEADTALDKHMKETYPGKDYKIYYWSWVNA